MQEVYELVCAGEQMARIAEEYLIRQQRYSREQIAKTRAQSFKISEMTNAGPEEIHSQNDLWIVRAER